MERVIPEQNKAQNTEPEGVVQETKIGELSRFSSYLTNKYASNVLLISETGRICYAGKMARALIGLQGIAQLPDIANEILRDNFLLGMAEAKKNGGSCLLHKVAYLADDDFQHMDIQFTVVENLALDNILVEVALLPYSTRPGKPSLDEKQLLSDYKVKELLHDNHFLNHFVTGAAHDLKGPMVVIKTYVDLIKRYNSEEKKAKGLEAMKDAAIKLERILAGLEEMVNFRFFDHRKVHSVSLERKFTLACYHLDYEIDTFHPVIKSDFSNAPNIKYTKAYLSSIFYNLLSNAIKYRKMDVPLEVDVRSELVDGFLMIVFKDNGIGMDMENFGHLLFEPFQRLCTDRDGTGLGLCMINKIVTSNGGRIEVTSQPGDGTEFRIYLKPIH